MISNLHSQSDWLYANTNPSSMYVGNQQSAGMLRYNTQNNHMEVYDGTNWMKFGSNASIGLTREAEEIMRWARDKMREDREFDALCREYPTLQDAYERLQIVKALVKQELQK